jgi:hypothetical protein
MQQCTHFDEFHIHSVTFEDKLKRFVRNDVDTRGLVGTVMVYNATSTIFAVISWRSGLLVEETGENHRPVANH